MADTQVISAYSIVFDPERSTFLVIHTPQGWTFPGHTGSLASEIAADLRRDYGLDVTVLARGWELSDSDYAYVYLCTAQGSAAIRDESVRWLAPEQLTGLRPAVAGQQRIVAAFVDGHGGGPGPIGAPVWTVPGWFDKASQWMMEQAEVAGLAHVESVEQYVVSPYSCTLRLPTDDGYLYLKAAPDVFAHEPLLVQALGHWFPGSVPNVVAVDAEQHWLLSRDVAPYSTIDDLAVDIDVYVDAVSRYARMQVEAVPRVEELKCLGVPDRRLSLLPDQFEELVADTGLMLTKGQSGLSDGEYRMLRDYVPSFRRTCEQLASYGIPETFQNTDFWRDCIAVTKDGFVFLDWAESILGHPLYSLTMVLRDPSWSAVPDRERLTRRLVDAYLSHWSEYLPEHARGGAFETARAGGIVCRALAWRDCLSCVEDQDRYELMRGAVARNMRSLLSLPGVVTP